MKRIIASAAGALAVLGIVLTAAFPALAAVGPRFYSPEQAGYAATGARFRYIQTTVRLPDATKFASNVSGLGLSVQLWTRYRVVVLGVSNTTATASDYSAAVAVYNRITHSLICSTASATQTCPNVPAGWTGSKNSFPTGDSVTLAIYYDRSLGRDFFDIFDNTAGAGLEYGGYAPGTGKNYTQARAGAEFSAVSPWDGSFSFIPPTAETHLATFTGCLLTTYSGQRSGFSSWWTHHKIFMTSNGTSTGTIEARPGNLYNFGHNFAVYLEPAS